MQQEHFDNCKRQRADETSLLAIGNKRRKICNNFPGDGKRKPVRRANVRDLQFVMSKDPKYNKSELLFRSYI